MSNVTIQAAEVPMPVWTSWKNGDADNPTSTITKHLKSKDIPATTVITMAKSSNVMQNTGDAEIHPPLPPVLNADGRVEKLSISQNLNMTASAPSTT